MEGDDRSTDVFRVANWYFVTLLIVDGIVEKALTACWLNEAKASTATPIRR